MTGRELIVYILTNHLEDEPVFADGKFIGLMTIEEAAAKFDVGVSTIITWYTRDEIDGVILGNALFICKNAKRPHETIY